MLYRLFVDAVNHLINLFRPIVVNIDLYMKNGQVVRLKNVSEFKFERNGNDIVHISWKSTTSKKPLRINVDEIVHIMQE